MNVQAVEDFHAQISNVASTLLDEFRLGLVQRRTQYKTERIIVPFYGIVNYRIVNDHACNKGVKEVDLYSAFIVVPHTQGAHVLITKCYLQITQYLPLPRKHSPDGASPRLRLQTSNCSLLLIYLPPKG